MASLLLRQTHANAPYLPRKWTFLLLARLGFYGWAVNPSSGNAEGNRADASSHSDFYGGFRKNGKKPRTTWTMVLYRKKEDTQQFTECCVSSFENKYTARWLGQKLWGKVIRRSPIWPDYAAGPRPTPIPPRCSRQKAAEGQWPPPVSASREPPESRRPHQLLRQCARRLP